MKVSEIRESFLSYFESKGCVRMPSSSLIPDDPSLLLTAAGMVQFKPIFLGVKKPEVKRATTVQKCVRTTDIDIIGTTGRHLSFFEMLGNFSFGDYFKREAIRWAWEYSTEVLKLDPERIWVSVFEDDDEAEELWLEETPVPLGRIVRMGEEDNFWAAGPTGPCGPCSELYYDQGESFGCDDPNCAVGCECDRYVEYWNLVFMQYNRDEAGNLNPLPNKSIDTGMGLERIAAILQGVKTNYETDELIQLIRMAEEITSKKYGEDEPVDIALRIIADHARSIIFMISDGVLPSNEGRGYVLRRLIRRAVRFARLLGVEEPFLNKLCSKVIDMNGSVYPELVAQSELSSGIIAAEEERFSKTLRTGLSYLDEALAGLSSGERLSGEAAFTLHDTYGFPIDLTSEIAKEAGIGVDLEGFELCMAEQKQRARDQVKDESWNTYGGVYTELASAGLKSEFVGYSKNMAKARVSAVIVGGAAVEKSDATELEIILDTTPFYAEGGGQIGDTGTIRSESAELEVVETYRKEKKLIVHRVKLISGSIAVGDEVEAEIDVLRRERTRRNHTATHILHWALKKILGSHAAQAGSYVTPERFRFDFTHFGSVDKTDLKRVEEMVNAKIFENHDVRAYETSLSVARESGVVALFGEKYDDFVRVLEVGNFSKELCGGTHVAKSSEIGFFKIISESSVGANLRRIEGVTSFDAYEYISAKEAVLESATKTLKTNDSLLVEKIEQMGARIKELEKARSAAPSSSLDELLALAQDTQGFKLIVASRDGVSSAELKPLWDELRSRAVDAFVFASIDPETKRAVYLAAGNEAATAKGFNAGALVKELASKLGGRGGGKPAMAQGGSQEESSLEAVAQALAEIKESL